MLFPRREKGFEFLRLFEIFWRFSRLGFTPRTIWYSTMFLPKVLRLRVAFAINDNLNMKLRNSMLCNGVQLCYGTPCSTHNGVLEVDATEVEEAQNPRRETEARNEK